MLNLALHDASTGFHDIKPLYDFSTPSSNLLPILIALTLISAALLLFLYKRFFPAQKANAPLSPGQQSLNKLRKLESQRKQKQIPLRSYAAELSLLFRSFLEDTFSLSAREHTRQELDQALREKIQKLLPRVSPDKRMEFQLYTRKLLEFCEMIICAQHSEQNYSLEHEEFDGLVKNFEYFVREAEEQLKKETERTQSVIDENKSRNRWTITTARRKEESDHAL